MDARILRAIQALTEAQSAIDELTRVLSRLRSDEDLAERVADAGLMMPDETLLTLSTTIDAMIQTLEELE